MQWLESPSAWILCMRPIGRESPIQPLLIRQPLFRGTTRGHLAERGPQRHRIIRSHSDRPRHCLATELHRVRQPNALHIHGRIHRDKVLSGRLLLRRRYDRVRRASRCVHSHYRRDSGRQRRHEQPHGLSSGNQRPRWKVSPDGLPDGVMRGNRP